MNENGTGGPKLVRDNIPQMIGASGEEPRDPLAEDGEMLALLSDKLREEVAEFLEARDPEELADILEVVVALADHLGIGRDGAGTHPRRERGRAGWLRRRIVWAGNPQR